MQQRQPTGDENKQDRPGAKRLRTLLDTLLPLALWPIGLFLIFTTVSLAMQRHEQELLPISLRSQISGDYGVDPIEGQKLAPVDPQIIEALKQDALAARSSPTKEVSIAEVEPTLTPTIEPSPTPEQPLAELAISAGGPYSGYEGSPIPLTAQVTSLILNYVPGAVTYQWDLDDDGMYDDAQGAAASVTFYDEDEYTVGVYATDWLGRTASDSTTIRVLNVPPLVNIERIGPVNEAEEIAFFATVSDPGHDVLFYEWDFGDGIAGVLDTLNPRHTYFDDGDYVVRLRVQDNDDGVTEDSLVVQVKNLSPLVDAGPDQVINESDTVFFSGTATDPAGDLDELTYAWDVNYDGRTFTPDAFGQTASATYFDGNAVVVAALRVEDEDGGQTIDTVNVRVNNVAPVIVNVIDDAPIGEGSPLTLQVTATDVGSDTLTYNFDWDNNGSFDTTSQDGSESHTWDNQGNYTIGIRVRDDDGGQAFTSTTISAYNMPPTAVAVGPSTAKLEGSAVNFIGSGSSDPGADVLTYTWSFGDGGTANTMNATHAYGDNNAYTATLTVTDDSGDSDAQSVAVNILNANPVAQAGPDRTIDEGAIITFNGTATDPGTADTLTFAWDFVYDGLVFDAEAIGPSVQTIYLDGPVTLDVALRVRDDDYPYPTAGGGQIGAHIDTLKVMVQNLPPLVEANGPYNGIEMQPTTLSGTATDVVLDLLTYQWDIDNNGVFDLTGQTVNYTWTAAGVYTVTLRVTDDDGGAGFDTAQVTIGNAPPTAEANGPYTTTVNLPVTLSAAGSTDPTGDPLTYRWDFGDGTPPVITNSITVTHIYVDDNVYTAILQVDDGRGGIDTDTATVLVNNLPPTAVITATPLIIFEGDTVTFDGSGSSDPGIFDTLTYQWDFGDGSPLGAGITVTHTYVDNNVYTATLIVTDDGGAVDTDSMAITVQNLAPTAVASANPNPTAEGTDITFDGSGSSDPGTGDVLTYQWDFGDGTVDSGMIVTHPYTDNGVFTATLTVLDGDGGISTDAISITTLNAAPLAVINANPNPVLKNNPVTFDGSGSSDPGTGDVLTYQWDFGDGSPIATGITATHSYATDNVYTATLTVTDDDFASDIDSMIITVQNANPIAAASASPNPASEGTVVIFDGSASNDPGGDPLTYQWNFGDGSPVAGGVTATHTYADDGVYTATLTVTDDGGANDATTLTITIVNLAPVIDAGGPYTTTVGISVTLVASATDVISDTLAYAWDLDNNGTFETPGQTVAYTTVMTTGIYTVVLQVDDGDGGVVTDTTIVQVNSLLPLAGPSVLYLLFRKRRAIARKRKLIIKRIRFKH